MIKVDTHNRVHPILKERITEMIQQYGATPEEIQQVYDHILHKMIEDEGQG